MKDIPDVEASVYSDRSFLTKRLWRMAIFVRGQTSGKP